MLLNNIMLSNNLMHFLVDISLFLCIDNKENYLYSEPELFN